MSIRIWLKMTATQFVGKAYNVETDNKSGGKYISIYADPNNPAASIPVITRKYVKRVSYTGKYYAGFRTDGIYHHKGATAHVETIENINRPYSDNDRTTEEKHQNISISAGSIKTLREIYSKIRTGELKPTEDWGVNTYELEQRRRRAEEKKAAPAEGEPLQH
jgi:hypothetical protein